MTNPPDVPQEAIEAVAAMLQAGISPETVSAVCAARDELEAHLHRLAGISVWTGHWLPVRAGQRNRLAALTVIIGTPKMD